MVNTPREAIRASYGAELLSDEETWLSLLEARNLSSHTYNDEVARRVYAIIRESYDEIRAAARRLAERLGSDNES